MSLEAMELAKISLDQHVQKIADALGLPYVNLDSTDAREKLDGTGEIVIAKLMEWDDAPRPPLYECSAIVGVKIHEDTNGYRLTELLKDIKARFPVDGQIDVADYGTTASPTTFDGYMVITRAALTGSNYEGLNLVQVLHVQFKAMIHAG